MDPYRFALNQMSYSNNIKLHLQNLNEAIGEALAAGLVVELSCHDGLYRDIKRIDLRPFVPLIERDAR